VSLFTIRCRDYVYYIYAGPSLNQSTSNIPNIPCEVIQDDSRRAGSQCTFTLQAQNIPLYQVLESGAIIHLSLYILSLIAPAPLLYQAPCSSQSSLYALCFMFNIENLVLKICDQLNSRKGAIPADMNRERWYFLTKFLGKSGRKTKYHRGSCKIMQILTLTATKNETCSLHFRYTNTSIPQPLFPFLLLQSPIQLTAHFSRSYITAYSSSPQY
jgi:hypothetical protein